MYCPKCNAQITGNEKVCPVCGIPFIEPTTPPVIPTPGTKMINPESVAEAVQSVRFEKVENKYNVPLNAKKERKKIPGIVKVIVFLLLILLLLYILAFSSIGTQTDNEKSNNINNSTIDEKTKKYGGYEFDIPDEYIAKRTRNGIEVTGKDLYFIIGIDKSNSYKMYMDNYCKKYNIDEENVKKTYEDKEYLLFNIRENSTNASIYITNGKEDLLFIGMVIRRDNRFATEEDLETVFDIIKNAKKDKKYKQNEDDNLGKYGLKIYQINPIYTDD